MNISIDFNKNMIILVIVLINVLKKVFLHIVLKHFNQKFINSYGQIGSYMWLI